MNLNQNGLYIVEEIADCKINKLNLDDITLSY